MPIRAPPARILKKQIQNSKQEDIKMAKKKVIYQITRTQYKIVVVETEGQEELIKE